MDKARFSFLIILLAFSIQFTYAQEMPPKHKPVQRGKPVTKICHVTGKPVTILAATGDVSAASNKGIVSVYQKRQKNKSKKGYVVTSHNDGPLMATGKPIRRFEAKTDKTHTCSIHCFAFEEELPEQPKEVNTEKTEAINY